MSWRHVIGASLLAGIGFTISIFVASPAFQDAPMPLFSAKIGTLAGSLTAGLIGCLFLRMATLPSAAQDDSNG